MEIHNDKLLIHKEAEKPSFKSILKILTENSDLNWQVVLRIQIYLTFHINKCCLMKLLSLGRFLKMLHTWRFMKTLLIDFVNTNEIVQLFISDLIRQALKCF